ncbi:MAG: hydrogenase nickel incorporation protein HypB, partial [Bacteroidales bacterium]
MCVDHGTNHSHYHHGHDHDHDHHSHEHHHDHSHNHEHHHHDRKIEVKRDILSSNQAMAERNRGYFEAKDICCINIVSSPGSGKTTLLEETIK